MPLHQPAGNSDIEDENDNTTGNHSAPEPAGATAGAKVNSDKLLQKNKGQEEEVQEKEWITSIILFNH